MKTSRILLVAVASIVLCACHRGGNNKTGEENRKELAFGVTEQTIGNVRLVSIMDNLAEKNHPNKLFYGKENKDSILVEKLSPRGEVASAIRCFLLEKDGKRILFDAGLGNAKGGQLLARLDSAGVKPADIDFVFLTHFHGDHIGGMLQDSLPVFPRATVYAPQVEADYWMKRNDATRNLQRAYGERLVFFSWDDPLPLEVKAIAAIGHTPGHTAYQTGKILIAGDLMHGLGLQLEHPEICALYDQDPEQSVATRKALIDYARKNRLVMAGMHFSGNGLIDLSEEQSRN